MQIKQLDKNFFASSQLFEDDLSELKKLGIGSIICNRPDGETEDQPSFAEIKNSADKLGIGAVHIPMKSIEISEDLLVMFEGVYDKLQKPVLAYCRTGGRSSALWNAKQPVPQTN